MDIKQNIVWGRKEQYDVHNRDFLVTGIISGKERSFTWPFLVNPYLDQGTVGCCVGAAVLNDLALRPAPVQKADNTPVTIKDAIEKIYWEAQKIDVFPGGEYPGAPVKSEGTSVLAGVKVAQKLGYYQSYYWAYDAYNLALAVGTKGPAIIGVNWYEGMMQPDKDFYLKTTGQILGGHAVCVRGVNFKKRIFIIQNSWGKNWGGDGCALLSFDAMDKLLDENGDAAIPINRNLKKLTI